MTEDSGLVQELRRSLARLELALAQIADGLAITDGRGELLWCNTGFEALVGWPRLKNTSVHYEITRLRAEVQELELRRRLLTLELERERNPDRLAERAAQLGLQPPPATHISAEGGP